MKRIDKLTETILNQYISEADIDLHAHSSGGWPPIVFFRGSIESGLTKRSISVPKSFVKSNGRVSTDRVIELLYKDIRRDISRGLGYCCGINIFGNFEVFFKRSTNIFYSRHDWEQFLKGGVI